MSFAERHKKKSRFALNTEGFDYYSLADLYLENGADKEYQIYAVYINTKSKYGAHPVLATSSFYIDIPKHKLDDVVEILENEEDINDINDGKVAIKIYKYEKKGKEYYSFEWVDSTDYLEKLEELFS